MIQSLSTEQFLELAQAIALLIRPTDPFANYEQLERFLRFGWHIHSNQLKELIGLHPKGDRFEWGGFVLTRVKTRKPWWKVERVDT
jgi:hypothetical protein